MIGGLGGEGATELSGPRFCHAVSGAAVLCGEPCLWPQQKKPVRYGLPRVRGTRALPCHLLLPPGLLRIGAALTVMGAGVGRNDRKALILIASYPGL